jgi:hypothetical protein
MTALQVQVACAIAREKRRKKIYLTTPSTHRTAPRAGRAVAH